MRPANVVWQFREPIATLCLAGQTVGRTRCRAEVGGGRRQRGDRQGDRARAGATAKDIPRFKRDVTERPGTGVLSSVTTVQRINTRARLWKAQATTPRALRRGVRVPSYLTPGSG